MNVRDIVFVLPGFLGFERTGNFTHFADRIVTALRGTLDARLGRSVPVVPLTRLPARSLAARQRVLLEALAEHTQIVGGAERVHLVGYSLGGLDAYLLTCKRPLGDPAAGGTTPADAEPWDQRYSPELEAVRSRIASVTSIASPLLGTCLASAKGAGSLTVKQMMRDPSGALHAAKIFPRAIASALSSIDSGDVWHGLAREGRKVAHFAAEIRRYQRLLSALTPQAMEELHAHAEPAAGVRRASVVTLAPQPDANSDGLFAELFNHTAGTSNLSHGSHDPVLIKARDLIQAALIDPARSIQNPRAHVGVRVDITTNDGVVNSCRQLIPARGAPDLLAVVVGDHFDVAGYYDRRDGTARRDREVSSGLLRSGSFFRDDEFFALYRKVGEYICETVELCEQGSAAPRAAGRTDDAALEPAAPPVEKPKSKRSRNGKSREATT